MNVSRYSFFCCLALAAYAQSAVAEDYKSETYTSQSGRTCTLEVRIEEIKQGDRTATCDIKINGGASQTVTYPINASTPIGHGVASQQVPVDCLMAARMQCKTLADR